MNPNYLLLADAVLCHGAVMNAVKIIHLLCTKKR